ncbi:outer membrane lipoprotein-sorting protein [Sphingobium sufflavum]|uniref:outer membrane lipoprotein-sorting protein n=1 Tax=Sphingobium sufflavum TaxID=1129547 RepID=UPI001F430450|nr:outer membrane lipoprotein-sorting protein [Sphingobium sufflavum]MCE7797241.1 outer membrane lipoprotein-sorting protein [Sphingobium sufflavum]
MKTILTLFALGFALAPAPAIVASADTPSAQDMVRAADAIRNPGQSFMLRNKLTEYVGGSARGSYGIIVYAKTDPASGQYQNIVRYVAPARDQGKLLLLSGTTLWFYDSASKSAVRIAPQQRLIGQASNGDVLTANLSLDYKAQLKGPATVASSDGKDIGAWELTLTRATKDAVYDRMTYWVEKGSYRPIKANFYSASGRLLKIAFFGKYVQAQGAMRPSETIIIDGVDPKLVTTINTSGIQEKSIPSYWFQRDYLARIPFN